MHRNRVRISFKYKIYINKIKYKSQMILNIYSVLYKRGFGLVQQTRFGNVVCVLARKKHSGRFFTFLLFYWSRQINMQKLKHMTPNE